MDVFGAVMLHCGWVGMTGGGLSVAPAPFCWPTVSCRPSNRMLPEASFHLTGTVRGYTLSTEKPAVAARRTTLMGVLTY